MRVLQLWLAFLVLLVFAATAMASDEGIESGFLNRSVSLDGAEYRYQVFVPREYAKQPSRQWPVILALHGSGERGNDGSSQMEVGLGPAIRRHEERFPAIVVFPQSPADDTPGWQSFGARLALAALDSAMAEFNTDKSRVYLTGLSMGGNGSWYLAYHHPDRFAALVVVCGWVAGRSRIGATVYPPIAPGPAADRFRAVAQRVRHLPIWIFHGEEDALVPVGESRGMAQALRRAGADVRYTEFRGVGHNAWDPAYDRADLFEWMFKQRRP
jgi:predicted peptidase